jgi:prolipoprotein diacylglyceryltransferase
MQGGTVSDLLARTATHEVNAWRILMAAGALAAFAPLLLPGRRRGERALGAAEGGPRASEGGAPDGAKRPASVRLALSLAAGVLGAAAGASLLPILLRLPAAIAAGSAAPLLVGDRMAIGAVVGFALAAGLAGRKRPASARGAAGRGARASEGSVLDRLAPSLGILVIFGRVGCFLEGCDFGSVTGVAWAVHYPPRSHAFDHQLAAGLVRAADAASLPVHPAQLYEAVVGLVMIGVAVGMERRAQRARAGSGRPRLVEDGAVFRATIATYAIGRFVVELFRGDVRGALGPLSLPQWMAVALLAWAAAGLFSERSPAPQRL